MRNEPPPTSIVTSFALGRVSMSGRIRLTISSSRYSTANPHNVIINTTIIQPPSSDSGRSAAATTSASGPNWNCG